MSPPSRFFERLIFTWIINHHAFESQWCLSALTNGTARSDRIKNVSKLCSFTAFSPQCHQVTHDDGGRCHTSMTLTFPVPIPLCFVSLMCCDVKVHSFKKHQPTDWPVFIIACHAKQAGFACLLRALVSRRLDVLYASVVSSCIVIRGVALCCSLKLAKRPFQRGRLSADCRRAIRNCFKQPSGLLRNGNIKCAPTEFSFLNGLNPTQIEWSFTLS